jgi:putative NADPH-quinone reductase
VTHWQARVLLVLAHPRGDSLTGQVAARIRERLRTEGLFVDFLDLYAEDFDPRMTPDDEPDWENPNKAYSLEVQAHMRRIGGADHIIVVFPIWWSGPPAILKGWVERTWTHGFAYTPGGSSLTTRSMVWVGLAGSSEKDFAASDIDQLIDRQLRVEISNFCRIRNARVRIIYDTVDATEASVLATIWNTTDDIVNEFLANA